jgi:hypothetical protein
LEGYAVVNRRFFAAIVVLVAGFSVCAMSGGRLGSPAESFAADDKPASDSATEIAKQEIAIAKAALEIDARLEQQGRADSGSASLWSKRMVEATRKSGATKAEIMQAIQAHLGRMEKRVELVKSQQRSARAIETDVLGARYDALEAKAWLAEEQAK